MATFERAQQDLRLMLKGETLYQSGALNQLEQNVVKATRAQQVGQIVQREGTGHGGRGRVGSTSPNYHRLANYDRERLIELLAAHGQGDD